MAAQLWWLRPESLEPSPAALAILDVAELGRHQRFIPPAKRHEFLVTRVLVRCVLGEMLDMAPQHVRFTHNEWGRPAVAAELVAAPIYFNVSHTEGLVVCLVSTTHEVGVDTEHRQRASAILKIAPRVFSAKERADLAALPTALQTERAVHLWTLKESYIKARGMGLALPLAQFSFCFSKGEIGLDFDADFPYDGQSWQFQTHQLGEHIISTTLAPSDPPSPVEFCAHPPALFSACFSSAPC
jgi:4'-phosphopantetheinyl transferase